MYGGLDHPGRLSLVDIPGGLSGSAGAVEPGLRAGAGGSRHSWWDGIGRVRLAGRLLPATVRLPQHRAPRARRPDLPATLTNGSGPTGSAHAIEDLKSSQLPLKPAILPGSTR